MKAYIASPFFNETQIKEVEEVEKEMARLGVDAFSPRLSEASKMYSEVFKANMDPSSPYVQRVKKYIFLDDLNNIYGADMFLVNLNNFDSGTLWELGVHLNENNDKNTIIPFGSNIDKLPEIISSYESIDHDVHELFLDRIWPSETHNWDVVLDFRKGLDITIMESIDQTNKDRFNYWIIAEDPKSGIPYRGLSKVILGSIYNRIDTKVNYIDVPRKSNIMLTQSGSKVYEYTGSDYSNEVFYTDKEIITKSLKLIDAGFDD